ncbi:hypothetical protein Acsp05_51340 [Actinokineospora sp. NBRC 105648]|nr:hypothetical protein Acsp05_51340 [Actinokineospora sp. NBRC 105648]
MLIGGVLVRGDVLVCRVLLGGLGLVGGGVLVSGDVLVGGHPVGLPRAVGRLRPLGVIPLVDGLFWVAHERPLASRWGWRVEPSGPARGPGSPVTELWPAAVGLTNPRSLFATLDTSRAQGARDQ